MRKFEYLVDKFSRPLCRGPPQIVLLIVSALNSFEQTGDAALCEVFPPESIHMPCHLIVARATRVLTLMTQAHGEFALTTQVIGNHRGKGRIRLLPLQQLTQFSTYSKNSFILVGLSHIRTCAAVSSWCPQHGHITDMPPFDVAFQKWLTWQQPVMNFV